MALVVREWTVHAAITVLVAATLALAVTRYLCVLIGFLFDKLVTPLLHPHMEVLMESVVVVIFAAIFGCTAGLLLPSVGLTVVTAIAFGWSIRSVRAIFAVALAVYCMALPPLLSQYLVIAVPSDTVEWSAAFQGENADVSRTVDNAAPIRRQYYVYYDDVTLGEGGVTDSSTPSASVVNAHLVPVEELVHTLYHPRHRRRQKLHAAAAGNSTMGTEMGVVTAHVVSVGDHTTIHRYGTARNHFDYIRLLGEQSRVVDSTLHCSMAAVVGFSSDDEAFPPCVVALDDVKVLNTTFYFYARHGADPSAAGAIASVHVPQADSCAALLNALEAGYGDGRASVDPSQWVQCLPSEQYTLDSLTGLLHNEMVPRQFVKRMPSAVSWRLYLPNHLKHIQEGLLFLFHHVCVPTGVFVSGFVQASGRVLVVLGKWGGEKAAVAYPVVASGANRVKMCFMGFVCGSTSTPPDSTFVVLQSDVLFGLIPCSHHTAAQDRERSFVLGQRLRNSTQTALDATLDALELVPGVWSTVKWAWDAEWGATKWVVQNTWRWLRRFVMVAPTPVWRVVCGVARAVGRVIRTGYRLVALVGAWLPRFSVITPLKRAVSLVLEEEKRELRHEVELLQRLTPAALLVLGKVFGALFSLLERLWGVVWTVLTWYSATSFSIEFSIVLLQTALLAVAMRNEVRDLVRQEKEEAKLRERAAGGTFFSSLLSKRLRQNVVMSKVNGFALFAKAHYQTCTTYVVQHLVVVTMLIGLSVLPFTAKLYGVLLHYVLPWVSSQVFLAFFTATPSHRQTAALFAVKVVLATLLQRTFGDLLYRLLKDMLIALVVFAAAVLSVLSWSVRGTVFHWLHRLLDGSLRNQPREQDGVGRATPPAELSPSPTSPPLSPLENTVESALTATGDGDRSAPPLAEPGEKREATEVTARGGDVHTGESDEDSE